MPCRTQESQSLKLPTIFLITSKMIFYIFRQCCCLTGTWSSSTPLLPNWVISGLCWQQQRLIPYSWLGSIFCVRRGDKRRGWPSQTCLCPWGHPDSKGVPIAVLKVISKGGMQLESLPFPQELPWASQSPRASGCLLVLNTFWVNLSPSSLVSKRAL